MNPIVTWSLDTRGATVNLMAVSRLPVSNMKINVRFLGGLTDSQQQAFTTAVDRWSEIITNAFEPVTVDGETLDGLLIEARGLNIDGAGRILGQAGPTLLRQDSMLPIKGIMEFDIADMEALEQQGTFLSVVLHEMGHVLGLGTIWETKGLLNGFLYTGSNALEEYITLLEQPAQTVPVEDTGGAGTAGGHWREVTFGDELMTGFLSGLIQPLSRLTIASLQDLGYTVDLSKADAYTLGMTPQRQVVGRLYDCRMMRRTQPNIL